MLWGMTLAEVSYKTEFETSLRIQSEKGTYSSVWVCFRQKCPLPLCLAEAVNNFRPISRLKASGQAEVAFPAQSKCTAGWDAWQGVCLCWLDNKLCCFGFILGQVYGERWGFLAI